MKREFTALTLKDVDDYEKNSSRLDVRPHVALYLFDTVFMQHCVHVSVYLCNTLRILCSRLWPWLGLLVQ